MKLNFIQGAGLASLCGLLFAACSVEGNAQYKGSGEMRSSGGLGKAYVQIDADTCAGNANAKGSFAYNDKNALDFKSLGGVAVTGTVRKAGLCVAQPDGGNIVYDDEGNPIMECPCGGWPTVIGDYTSTNPQLPGSGTYAACFYSDTPVAAERVSNFRATLVDRISFANGPYNGYENSGTLRGNIKGELCDVSASG